MCWTSYEPTVSSKSFFESFRRIVITRPHNGLVACLACKVDPRVRHDSYCTVACSRKPSWTRIYSLGVLELSSNSSWVLVGSWLFCLQNPSCLEVMWRFEQRTFYIISLRVELIFSTYWICQNEFDPQWTDIGCSLFKPPHDLQTCTKNVPNIEGFVSKTTNSLPEVMMS